MATEDRKPVKPLTQRQKNDRHRDKLLKRLSEFIFCDTKQKRNAARIMTSDQVHAALSILKKYMPDLRSVELKGSTDAPLITRIERVIVDPANDTASIPASAGTEPV